MNTAETLPALRPIDVVPVTGDDGQPHFMLHDQTGVSATALSVSLPGYFVIAHLDGRHGVADVQERFRQQFGADVSASQIEQLVRTLDDALLLHNQRFAEAFAALRAAYMNAPQRDNCDRWPDAIALRSEIEELMAGATAGDHPDLRGVIAPHLDYRRGGPCYRAAYGALGSAPTADRYVILGTNHFGRSSAVVATRKDFRTPLGDVATDREFLDRLELRLGQSICEHEFDHAREHSVELQVHILQVLNSHPFRIVPLLCPDPTGPTGTRPADGDGPDLEDFIAALSETLAQTPGRTILIAGADLSHVGRRFGDPEPATPEYLDSVARSDERLLALLASGQSRDFVASVRATSNETRICSVGCIYVLARVLERHEFKTLGYHQARDFDAETHVTCSAAVVC